MPIPNEKISQVFATSAELRSTGFTDLLTNGNVILAALREAGSIKTYDGAPSIRERLLYQGTGTYTRYASYEFLNVKPADVFTEAEFPVKLAAVSATISGDQILANSGRAQLQDLMAGILDAAEIDLQNNVNDDIHGDGTASGGRQIGGLQLIISTTPTAGTLANIDRGVWSFWRNKAIEAVATFGSPTSAANIQERMHRMTIGGSRGSNVYEMYVMGADYYSYYLTSLTAMQRIVKQGGKAGAGFTSLAYFGGGKEADVYLDGGEGSPMPAKKMYGLVPKHLRLRVHTDRNFAAFGGIKRPINQDAMTQHMGFAGNLTTNNPARLGVMYDA